MRTRWICSKYQTGRKKWHDQMAQPYLRRYQGNQFFYVACKRTGAESACSLCSNEIERFSVQGKLTLNQFAGKDENVVFLVSKTASGSRKMDLARDTLQTFSKLHASLLRPIPFGKTYHTHVIVVCS